MLTLIPAKIEHLKGSIGLAFLFELTLNAKQPFSGGMNGEFPKICGYPFAAKFFGYCWQGAGTAKKVGYEVAFVG